MPSVIPLSKHDPAAPVTSGIPPSVWAALNWTRLTSVKCRTAARVDLFEACALLHLDRDTAKRDYVNAFVRCFSTALGAPAIWHNPGESELSFDEKWLAQALDAVARDDGISLNFLLRSRLKASDRRYIGFLIIGMARQFSMI